MMTTRYLELMDQVCQAWERNDMPAAREAVDQALSAVSQWPERGHVLHAAGLVYGKLGITNQSIAYWEQFIEESGTDGNGVRTGKVMEGRVNLAIRLREAGRIPEAITAYQRAIDGLRNGGDPSILVAALQNVAWALCVAGDNTAAEVALNEAEPLLATDEDRSHQQIGRAFVAVRCGVHDTAMATCYRLMASQSTPTDVRAQVHWLMSQIALQQGMVAAAAQCVRNGLELATNASVTRSDLQAMQVQLAQAS
jgi:tetratricopeptide (TPR) repeat protein